MITRQVSPERLETQQSIKLLEVTPTYSEVSENIISLELES